MGYRVHGSRGNELNAFRVVDRLKHRGLLHAVNVIEPLSFGFVLEREKTT